MRQRPLLISLPALLLTGCGPTAAQREHCALLGKYLELSDRSVVRAREEFAESVAAEQLAKVKYSDAQKNAAEATSGALLAAALTERNVRAEILLHAQRARHDAARKSEGIAISDGATLDFVHAHARCIDGSNLAGLDLDKRVKGFVKEVKAAAWILFEIIVYVCLALGTLSFLVRVVTTVLQAPAFIFGSFNPKIRKERKVRAENSRNERRLHAENEGIYQDGKNLLRTKRAARRDEEGRVVFGCFWPVIRAAKSLSEFAMVFIGLGLLTMPFQLIFGDFPWEIGGVARLGAICGFWILAVWAHWHLVRSSHAKRRWVSRVTKTRKASGEAL